MLRPIHILQTFILIGILACHTSIEENYNFEQGGKASYYANSLSGNATASGEAYHPDSLTAAHRFLPLGTEILVVNTQNQKQLRLIVNDRGPFHSQRILDVSGRAADSLGFLKEGIAKVIIKAKLHPQLADSLNQMLKVKKHMVK